MRLPATDEARIRAALAAANARTAGEIVCVLAPASGHYRGLSGAGRWERLAAFAIVAVLVVSGADLLPGRDPWSISGIAIAVLVLQIIVAGLLRIGIAAAPGLWRFAIPRPMRYAQTRMIALEQFLVQGLARDPARAGVLIFVSLAERNVHILADRGLDQDVDAKIWRQTSRELLRRIVTGNIAEGYIRAVEACGTVLAARHPALDRGSRTRARFVMLETPHKPGGDSSGGDGDTSGFGGASACETSDQAESSSDGGSDGGGDGGNGGD